MTPICDDVWLIIIKLLTLSSFGILAQTCKHFRALCRHIADERRWDARKERRVSRLGVMRGHLKSMTKVFYYLPNKKRDGPAYIIWETGEIYQVMFYTNGKRTGSKFSWTVDGQVKETISKDSPI